MSVAEVKIEEAAEAAEEKTSVNKTGLKAFGDRGKSEEPKEAVKEPEKEVKTPEKATKKPEKKVEAEPEEDAWVDPLVKLGELLLKENAEKEPEKEEEKEEKPAESAEDIFKFAVSKDNYEQAMSSHENFVKVMEEFAVNLLSFQDKVFDKKLGTRLAQEREELLASLPKTVGNITDRQIDLKSAVDRFWDSNPDLKPAKQLVIKVASLVQSEKPDASAEEILKTTEELFRSFKKRTEVENKTENKNGKAAGLPTDVGGSREVTGSEEKTKKQKQLLTFLGR